MGLCFYTPDSNMSSWQSLTAPSDVKLTYLIEVLKVRDKTKSSRVSALNDLSLRERELKGKL